ncbi:MAG: septum formation family protein [Actinomyces urogenitalis]|uniref:Septum formation-related domain-containing protein n=1 Tax=Actinomyces urogenitalis TaxID=103621 RepID=A0A2I1KSB2_9ACTO|nr:septum formation family protein [Actinomyces urogenitalis]MDU0972257.1 septum formation family protein [Actinomyces urogenitalis]MDU6152285.1 septum formation family protein [Actinomyces urogenitalis]PKY98516.1 hypothetical protein CYJ26_06740 [Actinomyces urogenitalis]
MRAPAHTLATHAALVALLAAGLGACSGGTAATGSTSPASPATTSATPMADDAASPSASTSPDAALTSVQDLQAGDCFLPSSTEPQTSATEPASPQPQDSSAPAQVPSQIDLVTVVTCSQPHLYEVLSVTRLSEAALPELSALREQASVACQEAVSPYLENQTEHPTYRAQFLSPTQTSWKAGDRTLLCLLTSSDSTELTAAATR